MQNELSNSQGLDAYIPGVKEVDDQKFISLSLSTLIMQLSAERCTPGRIKYVVTSTRFVDEKLDELLDWYIGEYCKKQAQERVKLDLKSLWVEGKIFQPRLSFGSIDKSDLIVPYHVNRANRNQDDSFLNDAVYDMSHVVWSFSDQYRFRITPGKVYAVDLTEFDQLVLRDSRTLAVKLGILDEHGSNLLGTSNA